MFLIIYNLLSFAFLGEKVYICITSYIFILLSFFSPNLQ